MASRSKICTDFNHSNTGIVASNPYRDMHVYQCFSVLHCPVLSSGLETGWFPIQRVLPNIQKQIHKFQKSNSESGKARGLNPNLLYFTKFLISVLSWNRREWTTTGFHHFTPTPTGLEAGCFRANLLSWMKGTSLPPPHQKPMSYGRRRVALPTEPFRQTRYVEERENEHGNAYNAKTVIHSTFLSTKSCMFRLSKKSINLF
jgi:hypothetical protein